MAVSCSSRRSLSYLSIFVHNLDNREIYNSRWPIYPTIPNVFQTWLPIGTRSMWKASRSVGEEFSLFSSPPCICNLVGSCMWRVSEILKLWRETSGWRRCTTQPVWRLRWACPQRCTAVNINYSIQLRIQRITLCNLSCKRWRCMISNILVCCFLQTLGPISISA